VKAFLDTSVLVPVFYGDHQYHAASLDLFLRFGRKQTCCGVHSLAEVYSSLTRMPGRYRVSGEQAMLFLGTIRERMTLVALDADEYWTAVEASAASGVSGGTIYDALLARCALKAKAEVIYSWNLKHYELLGAEVAKRLRAP